MAEFYVQNEYWFAAAQLVLAMLGMGATLTGKDFRDLAREPLAVSVGTAVQLVAVPLTAYLFLTLLGVQGGVAVGIALIAAIPGGTVSNIFTFLSRGNSALSISITGITTFACLLTTPLILSLLISQHLPADFTMPRGQIITEIALTLLLPLAVGMAYLYMYPRTAEPFSRWCIRGSLLGILFIVVGSAIAGRLDAAAFGLHNILLVTLFTVVLTVMAWGVPRLLKLASPDVTAIEFEVVVRNVNLGVLIKASLFPAATASTASLGDMVLFSLLLYGALQLLIGALLIWLARRQTA
ncbi:bile acid:sodium symporter family protein [Pseudohalioglobus sediminis]|uniref:Bile acid:sodium symporter family protein n=1 Tax=Pseudohalioglobus sediminis TaxID=2606449 RepID=A0A5B0WXS5_9GAMM|nr:bile acid:sodium symporter [Pseudohalioglobus sediminis]KAA1191872.1 bile acid:sodium symporter family protein [Pseudohalioglobus sediminis]